MDGHLARVRERWNDLGRLDPMWAILTDPSKFGRRWSEDEFFASGRCEIDGLMARLDRLAPQRRMGRALDFGCGIGRLTRALREYYDEVEGVDVASSMIAAARARNTDSEHCRFHLNQAPNLRLFPDASFDLVYSNIVLQHIEPRLALRYVAEFARCTRPGGHIVFQLPHRRRLNRSSLKRYALHGLYRVLPMPAVRLYRRRKHGALPHVVVDALPKIPMEMHSVGRRRVERSLRGCRLLEVESISGRDDAFASLLYVFAK